MKKILALFLSTLFVLVTVFTFASHETYAGMTRGYMKKNGTYVAPALRSKPDKSKFNNYSCYTKGRCY